MKNITIGLALLMLLIACAPQEKQAPAVEDDYEMPEEVAEPPEPAAEEMEQPAEEAAPEEVAEEPKEVIVQPTPDEQPEVIVESQADMDPKLRDLLKRSEEKLKSMSYLYGGPETQNLFLHTYHLKNGMTKIELYEEDYYVEDGYYDTIYLHEGIACCEERKRCVSHNVDNTNKPFEINTSDIFVPKTPIEWTQQLPANAQVVGPQTLGERSVTFVTYIKDDKTYELLIDDTYGVTLKADVIRGEDVIATHKFNDPTFNQMKDADFEPPCV